MCLRRNPCLALLTIYQERGTNHKAEPGALQRDQTHFTHLKISQVSSIQHIWKRQLNDGISGYISDIPETGRN